MSNISTLIQKYDVPTPRYTSYPTVPYWDESTFDAHTWQQLVREAFERNRTGGLSLYIHLPFCEKLCTYCGCNKRITTNHKVEEPYIDSVLREWDMYLALFDQKPVLKELHLGGGTPTFFSADNLQHLLGNILQQVTPAPEHEFSFEAHPNNTTAQHLQTLYNLGFSRLSLGIQDFDERVQFIINRPQTFEKTKQTFDEARQIGYQSINADIIFGLPLQTEDSIRLTIGRVCELMPERIAFYSYAHVPWKSPAQRRYTEADLPKAETKRRLYELGRELLQKAGYIEIGMDHFALPNDALFKSVNNGTMHRNFMGYTTQHTELMLGLGVSSISDTWTAFAQNHKEVEEYEAIVNSGQLPVVKGHILNNEDQYIRRHILNLMCQGTTSWDTNSTYAPLMQETLQRLQPLANDGLVILSTNNIPNQVQVTITENGKLFLRNIALQFDTRYWGKQANDKPIFSKSI